MKKIRTAVVGVGYLGYYHAQKLASIKQSELVAICDINTQRASEVADAVGCQAMSDYHELIGCVDAVSIAAPTPNHFEIAKFFLNNGIHVLVEKPITTTLEEADELIALAKKHDLKLQVGHLERYNNVIEALTPAISNPRFIESVRLAPFKMRGIDVNVVLDLMIHDIDIIQTIVNSEVKEIRANGAPILSPFIDLANARIEFENGCVANVTASRVSLHTERKLRIFQHDGYLGVDLDKKTLSIRRKGEREMLPGIPEITIEDHEFDKGDALNEQIHDFINCIIKNRSPRVSGEDGRRALATAIQITRIVRKQNEQQSLETATS